MLTKNNIKLEEEVCELREKVFTMLEKEKERVHELEAEKIINSNKVSREVELT